jgi:hypothetical protein
MKRHGWVAIDKRLTTFLPKTRSYTELEAMFSWMVDISDCKAWTINGYAELWQWSRTKVQRFIRTLETGEDYRAGWSRGEHRGRGQPFRRIFNNLEHKKSRDEETGAEGDEDTTIDPNQNLRRKRMKRGTPDSVPSVDFPHFKRLFKPSEAKAVEAVETFLFEWERRFERPHVPLRPSQWQEIIKTILTVGDNDGMGCDEMSIEEFKIIVEAYFETKFRSGCDYGICHFNNPPIKVLRFCEMTL